MSRKSLFTTFILIAAISATLLMLATPAADAAAKGETAQAAPIVRPVSQAMASAEQSRFIEESGSVWSAADIESVQDVLSNTFEALAMVGIDGEALLDGYRFRRFNGKYINGRPGSIGLVNHETGEIVLSDAAFVRLGGFHIYHEIGHVVDSRLDRAPSSRFHQLIGSVGVADGQWETADGYWLRDHGREDREEATADAFALWVSVYLAGSSKPVFAGTPVGTQYDAIAGAIADTLAGFEG